VWTAALCAIVSRLPTCENRRERVVDIRPRRDVLAAKEGVLPSVVDMFGPGGHVPLDEMGLGDNYRVRVESLRDLIEVYDRES
jgi:hypothetical protein